MCPTDTEYSTTDDKLQEAAEGLNMVSSAIDLARQMVLYSWSATEVLRNELKESRNANDAFHTSYRALDTEYQDLKSMYNELSQDYKQGHAIIGYLNAHSENQDTKIRQLEEEKAVMMVEHRKALVVAADRIIALERALGGFGIQGGNAEVPLDNHGTTATEDDAVTQSDSTVRSTSTVGAAKRKPNRRPQKRMRKNTRANLKLDEESPDLVQSADLK